MFGKLGAVQDTGEFIGIDLTGAVLKIAHIKTSAIKKGAVNLISKDITNFSDDQIAEAVRTCLTEAKIQSPSVITLVPSNLAIIKNIEIPSVNPKEIKEIIDLQAARHTPYSSEEIIIGYVNIGVFKSNYTRVLLVIVNQDVVRKQIEILRKANLDTNKVVFKPEGLNTIVCKTLKLDSEELPVAIIHIDKTSSDFIVSLKGKIIFTRNISLGAQNLLLQDKEKNTSDFKEEIKKSLETYQSEEIGGAVSVFVPAGVEKLCQEEDFINSLKSILDVPIRAFSYGGLPVSKAASEIISGIEEISFLDVIGAVLTIEQLQIDLVPQEVKIQKVFQERSKNIIQTGVLVAMILVLIGGILMTKIYFKELYLGKLQTEYQDTKQKAQGLEHVFEKVQLVRDYLSTRGYTLQVLSQLYDLITPEIRLDEIKFDKRGTFSIKGTSTSMSSVFSFITSMEQSQYYKDVKTNYTRKVEEEGENLVDFEIVSVLE